MRMTKPCSLFDSSIILIMHEMVTKSLETEQKSIITSSSVGHSTRRTLHDP